VSEFIVYDTTSQTTGISMEMKLKINDILSEIIEGNYMKGDKEFQTRRNFES
jgi:hypothetical protein